MRNSKKYLSLFYYIYIFNKEIFISNGFQNIFIVKRLFDQKLEYSCNNCFKNVYLNPPNNTILIDYIKKKMEEITHKENVLNSEYCPIECDSLSYEISANNFYANDFW